MGEFCSFLVFRPCQTELVKSLCSQAGWEVSFIPDPSRRFRFINRDAWVTCAQASETEEAGVLKDGEKYGELLIIKAEEALANNIIHLIRASSIITKAFADQSVSYLAGFKLPYEDIERQLILTGILRKDIFFEKFTFCSELPLAVAIAAKAWPNKRSIYAIHKLAESYETECITPRSTHPHYGQIFEKHSNEFKDHVRTSIAINLAFSSIEELDLQIKSSAEKKRWLNSKTFEWNPEVLADIRSRLQRAGISPDITIDWIVRGDKTELEIEPNRGETASKSGGQQVRDLTFSLPDAIHACSYLRNFITAHAFGAKSRRLGPYEVYNTQQVARLLILSTLGFWKVRTRDLEARIDRSST